LIFLEEHKREWKQTYPEFEDCVLNMFDMPSQYHNNGKNGSYICISSQTEDFNNAENLIQAHFELQSFHGTKDTEQYRTKTFKIEILKSVCFNRGGTLASFIFCKFGLIILLNVRYVIRTS